MYPKLLAQNAEDFCVANTMYNRDPSKAGTARRWVDLFALSRPNKKGQAPAVYVLFFCCENLLLPRSQLTCAEGGFACVYPPGAAGFASDATHSLPLPHPALQARTACAFCVCCVCDCRVHAPARNWQRELWSDESWNIAAFTKVAFYAWRSVARLLAFLFCPPLLKSLLQKKCVDVFCWQIMM